MEQTKLELKAIPVDISVRSETKTVEVTTVYIDVEGEEFESEDLLNVLEEIEGVGDIEITNKRMCEHLKKIEVVSDCGSRRHYTGASKGPRFKDLYDKLCIIVFGP